MEEKKLNALPDEALDEVAGGAGYRFNEETNQWEVYNKRGKVVGYFAKEREAAFAAADLLIQERYQSRSLM